MPKRNAKKSLDTEWSARDVNSKPIKIGNQECLLGLFRDVTERKKAERELLIKENAVASSIDGMVIADLEGNVTYVNAAFVKDGNQKEVSQHSSARAPEPNGKRGIEPWIDVAVGFGICSSVTNDSNLLFTMDLF